MLLIKEKKLKMDSSSILHKKQMIRPRGYLQVTPWVGRKKVCVSTSYAERECWNNRKILRRVCRSLMVNRLCIPLKLTLGQFPSRPFPVPYIRELYIVFRFSRICHMTNYTIQYTVLPLFRIQCSFIYPSSPKRHFYLLSVTQIINSSRNSFMLYVFTRGFRRAQRNISSVFQDK